MKAAALAPILGSLLGLLPAFADAQITITECGQTVSGEAVLAADLDCSAMTPGLTLSADTELNLSGHSFTGDVYCGGDCGIAGPGNLIGDLRPVLDAFGNFGLYRLTIVSATVTGSATWWRSIQVSNSHITGGIAGRIGVPFQAKPKWQKAGSILVTDSEIQGGVFAGYVTIKSSSISGGAVSCAKCRVYDSSVSDSPGHGIACFFYADTGVENYYRQLGTLTLVNSQVDNNTQGGVFCARKATIEGSSFTGNGGFAVKVEGEDSLSFGYRSFGQASVVNSTFTDNAGGVYGNKLVSIEGTMIAGGSIGIDTLGATKITDSSISGASGYGIRATQGATLSNSDASGNGTNGECSYAPESFSQPCTDIFTTNSRPRLNDGSTCGTSLRPISSTTFDTWGVCSLDP